MTKNRVSADGGAMPSALPRRALLAGIAALPVATVPALATSHTADLDTQVNDLWQRRRGLITQLRVNEAEEAAARATLPWWALPGPELLNSEGKHVGPVSGLPAIQELSPPGSGLYRRIRLSRSDIEQLKSLESSLSRINAERFYQARLVALDQRLAARKALEEAAGLPAMEACWDALFERTSEIEYAINGMPGDGHASLAAKLLLEIQDHPLDDPPPRSEGASVACIALAWCRPHLTGLLAADVAELLDSQDRPMRAMRFYQGDYRPEGRSL